MATKKGSKVRIMDNEAIQASIKRMAYEVYEANYGAARIAVAGIGKRGGQVADRLAQDLEVISDIEIVRFAFEKTTDGSIAFKGDGSALKGLSLLVVDDVLYTGHTIFYAVAGALPFGPDKIQTAVLIDRGHRHLPVRPDYVGMELGTTLLQHVAVEITAGKAAAYLQ